jgi:predicted Zn-dependent protease with MMP-like domain
MEVPDDEDLFALYEGPAIIERSLEDPPEMPPRITLFYRVFLEACETEGELIEEIQRTIVHEVGHHFGLDEDRLEELGFG